MWTVPQEDGVVQDWEIYLRRQAQRQQGAVVQQGKGEYLDRVQGVCCSATDVVEQIREDVSHVETRMREECQE